jgi:hypothetical protein
MIFENWPPKEHRGADITIQGTARNAMAGALVVLSDHTTIYVLGLDEWDDATHRATVRVTGTLTRSELAPDPEVNDKGEHSTGMQGKVTVLAGARWELVS